MISIAGSMSELEQCHRLRAAAVECYAAALRNLAQYAVEVDSSLTDPHRRHLNALAQEVVSNNPAGLEDSLGTLRSLLRDYRDKAGQFLNRLKEDLSATAQSLEEVLEALAQPEDDHETRVRSALRQLRDLADSPRGSALRPVVAPAVDAIASSLDQIRKQHEVMISQFQTEIRMLHRRIDSMETAASIDSLTELFRRSDMEERVRDASPPFYLLMVKVHGFSVAEARYPGEVAAQCSAAFAKRLRNGMPTGAAIGRWSHDEFLVILPAPHGEVVKLAKWAAQNLSGSYSCLLKGKTVRPVLKVSAALLESGQDPPDRILARVSEFLSR